MNLVFELGVLGLYVGPLGRFECLRGGLNSELTHALEDLSDLIGRTFRGLDNGDSVVGVPFRYAERTDSGVEVFCDSEACGVVSGFVNSQPT